MTIPYNNFEIHVTWNNLRQRYEDKYGYGYRMYMGVWLRLV